MDFVVEIRTEKGNRDFAAFYTQAKLKLLHEKALEKEKKLL